LVHRVGAHRALELIYTAELINGERAEQIGLVNRVVDDDALIDTAREMVMSIANGPTQALLESKRIISGIIDDGSSLAEVLEAEAAAQSQPSTAQPESRAKLLSAAPENSDGLAVSISDSDGPAGLTSRCVLAGCGCSYGVVHLDRLEPVDVC
jgi:enoyl-CoA hydratase/carnithine racemase